MVPNGKTLLEYPVSSGVPQGSYYQQLCYYTLMTFLMNFFVIVLCSWFTIVDQGEGASYDFFNSTHQNWYPQWAAQKTIAPWKVKPPSKKWFEKKTPKNQKLSSILVTVSLIKQHWKKMTDISQKRDFHTWSIHSFIGKVKQYVRKYYIT